MCDKDIAILYVEDDRDIRDNLSNVLKNFSSKLFIAVDGKDGLEQYKQYNPDIVITDIKMPNLNGIDMVKAIKKINKKQHIIFTTAHSESDFFIEAIESHVDGYILKPIDLDLLEDKLQYTIEQIYLKRDYNIQQQKLVQSEKMASMGEMIGNIAHQWRQPLSVISTAATGILMKKEFNSLEDEELVDFCKIINKNAQYLSKTIDDFRDYIKGDEKKSIFILCDDIRSFLLLIEGSIKNNNINLILNLNKSIEINGYPNQLNQCMINIFNNAKDALKMQDECDRLLFITTTQDDKKISIILKDSGGGIDENIIDKIFEPYFTTKHKSQGTGLGLHMTYDLIISMGGSIKASNEEFEYKNKKYKGALFTIELPLNNN